MSIPKPTQPEEEYFAREEIAKLKKLAEEKKKLLAEKEKERLKQLHWMHCAQCGFELHEVLFHGIPIHKCFSCGGVFLSSEALEKLAGKESKFFPSLFSLFKY